MIHTAVEINLGLEIYYLQNTKISQQDFDKTQLTSKTIMFTC